MVARVNLVLKVNVQTRIFKPLRNIFDNRPYSQNFFGKLFENEEALSISLYENYINSMLIDEQEQDIFKRKYRRIYDRLYQQVNLLLINNQKLREKHLEMISKINNNEVNTIKNLVI